MNTAKEFFDYHGWVKIDRFLDVNVANFLYAYTKMQANRALVLEEKFLDDYDKDQYGKGPWNELKRLRQERELILSGVNWKHHGSGTVLVEDKFIYALLTGKWRVLNKNKWYQSKSVNHFIENYVRKDDD